MEIPRHWRLRNQRYRLIGLRDKETKVVEFPPKANPKKEVVIFSSSKLPSYTLNSCTVEQGTLQPQPVQ